MGVIHKLSHEEQLRMLNGDSTMPHFWDEQLSFIDSIDELTDDLKQMFIKEHGIHIYKKLQ